MIFFFYVYHNIAYSGLKIYVICYTAMVEEYMILCLRENISSCIVFQVLDYLNSIIRLTTVEY